MAQASPRALALLSWLVSRLAAAYPIQLRKCNPWLAGEYGMMMADRLGSGAGGKCAIDVSGVPADGFEPGLVYSVTVRASEKGLFKLHSTDGQCLGSKFAVDQLALSETFTWKAPVEKVTLHALCGLDYTSVLAAEPVVICPSGGGACVAHAEASTLLHSMEINGAAKVSEHGQGQSVIVGGLTPDVAAFRIHVACMALAWGMFLPIGAALVGRLRGWSHGPDDAWFRLHKRFQITGWAFSMVGFIAVLWIRWGTAPHGYHEIAGMVIAGFGALQPIIAAIRPAKTRKGRRSAWFVLHGGVGWTAIAFGFANVWTGVYREHGNRHLSQAISLSVSTITLVMAAVLIACRDSPLVQVLGRWVGSSSKGQEEQRDLSESTSDSSE